MTLSRACERAKGRLHKPGAELGLLSRRIGAMAWDSVSCMAPISSLTHAAGQRSDNTRRQDGLVGTTVTLETARRES